MKKFNDNFKLKDLENYNTKEFNDIQRDLEEEKAYLTRLIQKAKNDHTEFKLNYTGFNEEIEEVEKQIEGKENLLYTLSQKKSRPIPRRPINTGDPLE